MAVNVVITPGGLFKRQFALQDLLMQGMSYGILDEAFRMVENQMSDITVLFNPKHICRGMEISFEGKQIVLRLPLPNDEIDIRYFYEFIKHVCEICHTRKFVRDEEIVSVNDVENCILIDLGASEKALKLMFTDKVQYKTIIFFGAINPIVMGQEEMDVIDNNLNKFGEFMNKCQQMDVYYAAPGIFEVKDKGIIGLYTIPPDVLSVASLEPSFLMSNDIKVDAWYAYLQISENESVMVNYNDFVEFIDKTKRYDGNHVIINIPKKDMHSFARAHKVEI